MKAKEEKDINKLEMFEGNFILIRIHKNSWWLSNI